MAIYYLIITGFYVMLMAALLFGWLKIPLFKWGNIPPSTGFSIVIPYRNEAENLKALLPSLIELQYPGSLFEILLVNDASEDESEQICFDFMKEHPKHHIFLLNNVRVSNSPKKDAISIAIENSLFDHIITTDADCIVPKNWLKVFDEKIITTGAKMIAGPVKINSLKPIEDKGLKLFHAFQEMDFMSLQIAGAGGFGLDQAFMCNGANLCYNRLAFYGVEGFSGNDEISSGDDVFLLQKFVKNKLKVVFLKSKEAIVHTQPQPDLTALISQRIRWAAKTPAYKSWFAKFTGLTVLAINFSLVTGFALCLFNLISYTPVLLTFFFKFLIDLVLLFKSARFFDRKEVLRNYFWSSLVYPFFSTSVAFLSMFKSFEWKGRKSRS